MDLYMNSLSEQEEIPLTHNGGEKGKEVERIKHKRRHGGPRASLHTTKSSRERRKTLVISVGGKFPEIPQDEE